MGKIVTFFSRKKIGDYLTLLYAIIGIVLLILYVKFGTNNFNPNYSVKLFVFISIAVVLGIISFIIPIRACSFIAYLCFLASSIEFIVTQLNYLANLIYNIDGEIVSSSFIAMVVLSIFATATALTAGILTKKDFIYKKLISEELVMEDKTI